VTVSFNLAPNAALSGAITEIENAQKTVENAGQYSVWISRARGCI
jgi:hypothetical protein